MKTILMTTLSFIDAGLVLATAVFLSSHDWLPAMTCGAWTCVIGYFFYSWDRAQAAFIA